MGPELIVVIVIGGLTALTSLFTCIKSFFTRKHTESNTTKIHIDVSDKDDDDDASTESTAAKVLDHSKLHNHGHHGHEHKLSISIERTSQFSFEQTHSTTQHGNPEATKALGNTMQAVTALLGNPSAGSEGINVITSLATPRQNNEASTSTAANIPQISVAANEEGGNLARDFRESAGQQDAQIFGFARNIIAKLVPNHDTSSDLENPAPIELIGDDAIIDSSLAA